VTVLSVHLHRSITTKVVMSEFEYNKEIDDILRAKTGDGQFLAQALPDVVIKGIFQEHLWLMKGRVEQWWRSAEYNGSDLGAEVSVAINDSGAVSAYALPDARRPVITLSAGACVRIRQLMHMVVWDMKNFPARKPEGVIPAPQLLASSLDPNLSEAVLLHVNLHPDQKDDNHLELLLPVAPTERRNHLAKALTLSALDFLIMHEISHIVRGQSRYLQTDSPSFFEGFENRSTHDGEAATVRLTRRQLLEFEADVAAGPASARQFGGVEKIIPLWREWTEDVEEVQDLWLTSLALLFSFINAWSAKSSHPTRNHPPPGVRLLAVASSVFDELTKDLFSPSVAKSWHPEAHRIAGRVFLALERAAHVWEVFDLPVESARLVTTPKSFRSIVDEFNLYREKLLEFQEHRNRG
jgi:hypothetical protein